MAHLALVPLAEGLSDFEAKVVTARLGADGIIWEIRGVVDSVYPFGSVDVLVPRDELDDAHACLAVADGSGLDVSTADDAEPVAAERSWWFAALVCAGAITFAMMRLLAVG